MSRTAFWNVCKYLLAFGLLAFVVWQNWKPDSDQGLEHVWNRHVVEGQPVQYGYLLAAFAIYCVGAVITIVRWYFLVRAQGLPFRMSDAFRLGFIGIFFNTFLPGSVGGDIVKAAGIAREQSRRTTAVATVIMDRGIAVWGMVWFVAILGGIFWWTGLLDDASPAKKIVTTAGIIVAASVVVWVLLGFLPQHRAERFAGRLKKIPKIGHSASEFWLTVWMYRCRQKSVGLALVLTWLGQVAFVLSFYCCARVLWAPSSGTSIPALFEHFLLVPIGLIIQGVPLFPGGAGIGEAGFGGLYAWFGCAAAAGVVGSLVLLVIKWVTGLISFLFYLKMKANLNRAEEQVRKSGIPPHLAPVTPALASVE